jgi:hypothetical protein
LAKLVVLDAPQVPLQQKSVAMKYFFPVTLCDNYKQLFVALKQLFPSFGAFLLNLLEKNSRQIRLQRMRLST